MTTPGALWGLPYSTGPLVQNPTSYKSLIDADMSIIQRVAAMFAPAPQPTPNMTVLLSPGHVATLGMVATTGVLSGTTAVTSLGSTAGIQYGMSVTGPGIPANTTVVAISTTGLTLSNAATLSGTFTLVFSKSSPLKEIGQYAQASTTSSSTALTSVYGIGGNTVLPGVGGIEIGQAVINTSPQLTLTPTATMASGNATITAVSSTQNVQAGMAVSGTNIASGTTVLSVGTSTITLSIAPTGSGTNTITIQTVNPIAANTTVAAITGPNAITLSQAATASLTNVQLAFCQITSTIVAPVSNSRLDRMVVDQQSGLLSVVAGTPGALPVAPAVPQGKAPVGLIYTTTSTTTLLGVNIFDDRELSAFNRVTLDLAHAMAYG